MFIAVAKSNIFSFLKTFFSNAQKYLNYNLKCKFGQLFANAFLIISS